MTQAINGLATLAAHGFPQGALDRPVDTSFVNMSEPESKLIVAALSQYKSSRAQCALPLMLQYSYSLVTWPTVTQDKAMCGYATSAELCETPTNCTNKVENTIN